MTGKELQESLGEVEVDQYPSLGCTAMTVASVATGIEALGERAGPCSGGADGRVR